VFLLCEKVLFLTPLNVKSLETEEVDYHTTHPF
jgi:hypothetical protein